MRATLIIALFTLLAGCADSHQWQSQQQASAPLNPKNRFYISTPADGQYGAQRYEGSGRNTVQIIYNALVQKTRAARIGRLVENHDDALTDARAAGQDVLIFPTILHWEDRATEWSMIPDKVEVKIDVIEVSSGDVLSSGIVKGKSGLATFGGDHPQDLLPEPITNFVHSIF
ncbi:DUF4823 domain-containing protein [Pseudomonas sp. Mn2068]|uniref:DUF4823 domain-containing protein n=1 Tax=Pseudomonas sp. Mn2068 TaxID=3395265 RepID=UPI003BBFA01B